MEESVVCYICYEPETKNNSYLKEPPPCECKGSIVIHKQCFDEIIKTSRVCSICRTKYKIQYLPNRNGLELITEVAINGDITEYTIDEEGDKQGLYTVKKQSGEIISESNYLNGLLHGKYKSWYLNGQLECECNCFRNKIEGEYKSWYENGQLMEHSFYVEGLKDGMSKQWDINGKMKHNRVYIKGECPIQV
jgi:antitoxin component YwqK of YwqJK toxin-antitoxin module